jgi:demethylmenaquinone methyltransferase/2-methoxy-6-polyprenyl-1,4-benzoquinol methylase
MNREMRTSGVSQYADLPRSVFSPIARNYDGPAAALSLFQYRRWHRFLLARLDLPQSNESRRMRVLDMATGTGSLALDLARMPGVDVVGGDITRPMLMRAWERAEREGAGDRVRLVECSAEMPPFADGAFDAMVFAYLLRYVNDVPSTLCRLAPLVKPGGTIASLDFAVPRGLAYPLWRLYTGVILPAGGQVFSSAWRRTGSFLGPNIRSFCRRWPEERLLRAWRDAGMVDVRSKRLSLGGAMVIWGRRPM